MLIFYCLLLLTGAATLDRQPNIIYILSDDLGHADVGFTNGFVETPVLNKMARQGIQLDQHYVQQVCTPTRGALMSGRYPIHTGLHHEVIYPGQPWGLPLNETIIPQVLKQYDYTTHAVGKWHLGMHKWSFTPVHRGFDDFFGYYLGAQNYNSHVYYKGYDFRHDYTDEKGNFVDDVRYDLKGQYSAELYATYVQDLLRGQLKEQKEPFFIYMAFQNVHAPHMVPQRYIDEYTAHLTDPKEKTFAAMVSAMDEAIGNITATLEETGLSENTVVVFSSDNGGNVNCVGQVTSSNYPYRGGKRALYEGGVKSPSFIWAPKILNPGRSRALIHVTDWLPTFWHLASLGGTIPPNKPIKTQPLDGIDQWLAISKGLPSNRTEFLINIDPKPVYCGHQVPHAGIRWGDWKLILGAGGPPFGWYPAPTLEEGECSNDTKPIKPHYHYVELYNIVEDPSETKNVSHKFPDLVAMLTAKLEAYNATVVPMLNKKTDPASNPANFNNTWIPWLGEEEEVKEGDDWLDVEELMKQEGADDYSLTLEFLLSLNKHPDSGLGGCWIN